MQKDSFAKRFCPRLRSFGVFERDLDGVRHRAWDIWGKQGIGVRSENFRDATDIRGDHRNAGRRRLDHDIGHRIPTRWNNQHIGVRKAVSRLDVTDEADRFGQTEPLDLSLESFEFLAIARQRQRHRFAVGVQPRHRIDQEVRSLDMPELADIDDIGGVIRFDDRIELFGGHAIEHAAHQALGGADGALEGIARECTFEQEQVGRVHQRAFEATVERALERVQRVVQRAAMRRIDANDVF